MCLADPRSDEIMSNNKSKVSATDMLEISVCGGENLQGYLVGQLVFDKGNPFTAEILQATSAAGVIKIKDNNEKTVIKELAGKFEDGKTIDPSSKEYSSPSSSVLTTKTYEVNGDETCDFKNVKEGLTSPFQDLGFPSEKVHCNSSSECLRAGIDNEWKYNSLIWNIENSYNFDLGNASYKVTFHFPLSYSGLDSFTEIGTCPGKSKRNTYRLSAGMDQWNGDLTEKFQYNFAGSTNDILKMETLEDKPPQPQFQLPSPRPELATGATCARRGMDATCWAIAGLDISIHSVNNKMNRSETPEDLISRSTSVKTEHLRAGMDCIPANSFKSIPLENKKQNLDLLAYHSVENISLNTRSDINGLCDTKSNCGKVQSSSMLSSYSNKYKDEFSAYDSPIVEIPCKKSSEVTYLRAGMDFKSISSPRSADEFSQFSKYRSIDKNACGTYDIQELETLEDLSLTRPPPPTKEGGACAPPPKSPCTGPSGKEPNDLDYFVHHKYRNVDKSCDGELDVQEGELRDIRLLTLCCPEAPQSQSACQPRPNCPKMDTKPKCNQNNKERHSCATFTCPRPPIPLGCISPCYSSCSPSPRSSPCSSPRHSPTSSICSGHQRKHYKADCVSSYDYCGNDAESDSKTSEISGLLKQEIRRLRKINEEALAMISAHRCSTQQNLSKKPLVCESGRTASNYCNARSSSVCDSGADKIRPPANAVNFQVSGTFNLPFKDKEGPREEDMTITSMQIMSGCNDYKPSTSKEPSSSHKEEPEESDKPKAED